MPLSSAVPQACYVCGQEVDRWDCVVSHGPDSHLLGITDAEREARLSELGGTSTDMWMHLPCYVDEFFDADERARYEEFQRDRVHLRGEEA